MGITERCWIWRRKSDGEVGMLLTEHGILGELRESDLFEVEEFVPASQSRGAVAGVEEALAEVRRIGRTADAYGMTREAEEKLVAALNQLRGR